LKGGWDSVVSNVTQSVQGLNPSGGKKSFKMPVQSGTGAHSASYTVGAAAFVLVIKQPGHGVDYPPVSSTKIANK